MKMSARPVKFVLWVCLIALLGVIAVSSVAAQDAQPQAVPGSCSGSLPNQLSVAGQTGHVARYFSTLRAAPASNQVLAYVVSPAEFVVAAPPDAGSVVRCVNNLFYVYVQYTSAPYAGLAGWATESEVSSIYGSNLYWLEPFTPEPPPPPSCEGSLPNVLDTVGEAGQIAERFSTLRTAPGGAEGVVVNAPANFVVAAPADGGASVRCAGGYVYVYIQYTSGAVSGQAGWALESERVSIYGFDRYWLEPAGS